VKKIEASELLHKRITLANSLLSKKNPHENKILKGNIVLSEIQASK
jgi:hypothetical protein